MDALPLDCHFGPLRARRTRLSLESVSRPGQLTFGASPGALGVALRAREPGQRVVMMAGIRRSADPRAGGPVHRKCFQAVGRPDIQTVGITKTGSTRISKKDDLSRCARPPVIARTLPKRLHSCSNAAGPDPRRRSPLFDLLAAWFGSGFRGASFMNAATEFASPADRFTGGLRRTPAPCGRSACGLRQPASRSGGGDQAAMLVISGAIAPARRWHGGMPRRRAAREDAVAQRSERKRGGALAAPGPHAASREWVAEQSGRPHGMRTFPQPSHLGPALWRLSPQVRASAYR